MFDYLLSIDHNLFWLINSHHTLWLDFFFSIITNLGNGWIVTPILLVIIIKKNPRNRLTSFIVMSVILMTTCGMINTYIKKSANRPRPAAFFKHISSISSDASNNPDFSSQTTDIHIVGKKLYRNSFPSGHANTAFSAATIIASFGGLYNIAFIPAFLVGYSRIYMGAHFPSDVAAGGFSGWIIMWTGLLIYKSYIRKRTRINDKQ
jgi:membrane-associated phospholipid phosphatase